MAAQVWSRGICGGQTGAGAGFLQVLRLPLPIFIPPIAQRSPSSIIWGWYNGPIVAIVKTGLSLTPLRIIIIKIILKFLN
jgi:cyanate permease